MNRLPQGATRSRIAQERRDWSFEGQLVLKSLVKQAFRHAGFKIEWRDRLEESIPPDYARSPFLPRIYRGSLHKLMYWKDMIEETKYIEGDIVECGVSIGHGTLLFLLLCDLVGIERTYYGFDSFEGFPDPSGNDQTTPIGGKGFYASPPETVLKVLRDGRIPEDIIGNRVHLIQGWFDETIPKYGGTIALLHLDCDLYESYKVCLKYLYEKVATGGVIMFDEYNDQRWPGAKKAVNEFFSDKPEKIVNHEQCDWKYYVVKE